MNEKSRKVFTGLTLTPYEREIIQKESERRGLYNFSATVRQIIREWEELSNRIKSQEEHS